MYIIYSPYFNIIYYCNWSLLYISQSLVKSNEFILQKWSWTGFCIAVSLILTIYLPPYRMSIRIDPSLTSHWRTHLLSIVDLSSLTCVSKEFFSSEKKVIFMLLKISNCARFGLVQVSGEVVLHVGISEMVNHEFISWWHFGHKGLWQQINS